MKNIVIKKILAICMLVVVCPLGAAERIISLHGMPLDAAKLDHAYQRMTELSDKGLKINFFKRKAFYVKEADLDVIPGEILGKNLSYGNECFVYVKGKHERGKVFTVASKVDKLWHCAGEPVVSAKSTGGKNGGFLILAMYLYQAPSGEAFYISQVIEVAQDGAARTGDVDQCIEKKTDSDPVKSMRSLSDITAKCLVDLKKLLKN